MRIARMKLVAAAIMASPCAFVPAGPGDEPAAVLSGPDGRSARLTCQTVDGPTLERYFPGGTLASLAGGPATFGLPFPPAAVRDEVAGELEGATHDLPIPLNGQVLAYLDLFRGSLRDWFQEALQRSTPHLPMIERALRAEGLPLDLAYIPIVESAFEPEAVSKAGAKGLWQFMRGTAIEQGLRYDWDIDERANPEKSTAAAIRYLKRLNVMFEGDWHLTLASYNGGPGRVRRAMRRQQTTGFWSLAAQRRALPRQTREYVPMVLAAMVIGRNPAQYGFTVTQAERPSIDAPSLARLRGCAGIGIRPDRAKLCACTGSRSSPASTASSVSSAAAAWASSTGPKTPR